MNLAEKKVVLTGATGGIGQALAKALAGAGCHLLLTGRNEQILATIATEIGSGSCSYVVADLTTADGRAALFSAADVFSPDILINGLGVNQLSFIETMTDAELAEMVNTNLLLPMQICRGFIPLLKSKPSIIVNLGSILGSIGYAGSAAYCASKFGLRGFTEALRRELHDTSVRVIYFAPRATDTTLNSDAMQALNKELKNAVDAPEQVAQRLLKVLRKQGPLDHYLGWPEAFFVRLNSLLPRLVDKALFKQLPIIGRHANTNKSNP